MRVVVASQNPTKVSAVKDAFTRLFGNGSTGEALEILPSPPLQKEGVPGIPLFRKEGSGEIFVTGVTVDTGVSDQPVGDEETKQGALNRAVTVRTIESGVDFWVGIETGVVWHGDELECVTWVTVLGADRRIGKARSNGFFLPPAIAELIRGGMNHSDADDRVFGRQGSGRTNGTVGYLSHNLIDRTHYTVDAVILALAPFVHPEHFPIQARDLLRGDEDSSMVEESLQEAMR